MYLAVDIGGTKTLIALFSKRGRILRRIKFKTSYSKKKFLDDLCDALNGFKKYNIKSVTVAIPGIVQKNYSVKFGNRDWVDVRIYDLIKNLFNKPVFLENDANLATLYESSGLLGRVVFLTFSTGIGGGIVENGEILPESGSFEPGHKVYHYDGKELEWEDIAAASALEKYYHVDCATDIRKQEILKDVAHRIYLGIPDIIKDYNPSTIILGGPMGKIFRLYSKYLPSEPSVRYRRPKRPNESVIYGCYLYAKTIVPSRHEEQA